MASYKSISYKVPVENFPVNLTYEVVKTPRKGGVIRSIFILLSVAEITLLWAGDPYESTVKPFVENYCAACHDKQAKAGGLDLTPLLKMSAAQASKDKKLWEKIYERVSAGEMPKKGALLPTGEEIAPVLEWIEIQLKR